MSWNKAELRHIAENLIDDLREMDDGDRTTTWCLMRNVGYDMDEFETFDLFGIHDFLFRAARANHITLDMSEHDGKAEGLPFNFDFIVRNKKAQIKCPYCGSKDTARYLYGYPTFSEDMQNKINEGKWALGGCCINAVEINGETVEIMPARRCNKCKRDFGTAPILITPKNNTAEDYRDIVTSIRFLVGGFFQGNTEITISKNDKGASVSVRKIPYGEEVPEDREITYGKWNKILNRLYTQMYLHEWKKSFVNPCVMDGTQWELEIKLTGNRKRNYHGSNAYPPYWAELTRIFREFSKL